MAMMLSLSSLRSFFSRFSLRLFSLVLFYLSLRLFPRFFLFYLLVSLSFPFSHFFFLPCSFFSVLFFSLTLSFRLFSSPFLYIFLSFFPPLLFFSLNSLSSSFFALFHLSLRLSPLSFFFSISSFLFCFPSSLLFLLSHNSPFFQP